GGGGGDDGDAGGRVMHRTARVDQTAHVAQDVSVGAYSIIGPKVTIGEGCRIAAHVVLERNARLGAGVKVGYGGVIGTDPQDLKSKAAETWVVVGEGPAIGEDCRINGGPTATGGTAVGQPRCR